MKKIKLKVIALALLSALAICIFASCNDEVVDTSSASGNTSLPEGYAELASTSNTIDYNDPNRQC